MQPKSVKEISNRQFSFFIGITLVLLSIVLTVNVWVIARSLSFIFTFLFGYASYLIYGLILIQGVSLVIRGRLVKIGLNLKLLGFIITFVSICLLITTFARPNYNAGNFGDFFVSLDYIASPGYMNLFTNKVAGGFVGSSLFSLLNGIAEPVPFIIGFLVLFVGLAFVFMNPILALFAIKQEKRKNKAPKQAKPKAPKRKQVEEGPREISLTRDNTNSVIKGASYIEEPLREEPRPISSQPRNESYPRPQEMSGYPSNLSFNRGNSGGFTPAHFIPGVIPGDAPSSVISPAPSAPVNPEPAPAPSVQSSVQPVVEERREEQLTLDFDNPLGQQVDQSVVTAQPTFEVPNSISNPFNPAVSPAPTPTPVPANNPAPAVKKPIKWIPPSSELLETYEISEAVEINKETAEQRTILINQIFEDFKIGAEVDGYVIGPAVTRYNIRYQPHVSAKSIEKITTDISIRLGGVSCRFEPVVEGSYYSGLEIPNARVTMVSFKDVYDSLPDVKKHPFAIGFGKNVQGEVISADFNGFPHVLVAGTTGSGKSIFIHSIISTLIMRNSPDNLRLVLVDPKRVEMVKYRDIPHLLCPIINDPHKVKPLLDKLVEEMNHRYDLLAEGEGFQDIKEYNEYADEHNLERIPTIVAILDEFGDLVETCKEISQPIVLIGQKARACGIHMLIATQSPTSDIITGSIKSNLPTHVALMTANTTQSVTILGEGGAEKLLGRGDMLVQSPLVSRVGLARLQGCYIAGKEISRIAGYLREHYETIYDEKFLNLEEEATIDGQIAVATGAISSQMDSAEEMKYQSIKEYVMTQQYTSMSRIQRDCSVGFNRAGRFFNRLVAEGVVNPVSEGNKGCRVMIHDGGSSFEDDSIPVSDELND